MKNMSHKKLEKLLKEKGKSKGELADLFNITTGAIAGLFREGGRKLSLYEAYQITGWLGCSYEDLLDELENGGQAYSTEDYIAKSAALAQKINREKKLKLDDHDFGMLCAAIYEMASEEKWAESLEQGDSKIVDFAIYRSQQLAEAANG